MASSVSAGDKDDLANLEAEFQEIINELTDDPNFELNTKKFIMLSKNQMHQILDYRQNVEN